MPSDRSFQRRVDLVQQEISVVKSILANQQHIISRLQLPPDSRHSHRTHFPSTTNDHYASRPYRPHDRSVYPPGNETLNKPSLAIRTLFLADCRAIVEQREDEFRRYAWYAEDLGKAIANKVDWTKDRQENAIYAFTIVTIVFLPISAVSSIFGMNTSDVRDMNQGIWLYWAVALPVTIGVIIGGLWWMHELDTVVGWLTGRRSRRLKRLPALARQDTDVDTLELPLLADSRRRDTERSSPRVKIYNPVEPIDVQRYRDPDSGELDIHVTRPSRRELQSHLPYIESRRRMRHSYI